VVRFSGWDRRRLAMIMAVSFAVTASCGPHDDAAPEDNPFAGAEFFVDPGSSAAKAAAALRAQHPHDAAELDKIAHHSQADWFGDWVPASQLTQTVAARRRTIHAAGALPVFVVYDIPLRDCHGYSGGGASSPSTYRTWIRNFAAGVGAGPAAVIVEPDALAQIDCLTPAQRATRLGLLRYAVRALTARPGTAVYLDAGHAGWIPAATMARRLRDAGVSTARGFSLNVSNYDATSAERAYGRQISSRIGGKPFVIDTSRNGLGSNGEWCNARDRALGTPPTGSTGDKNVDAFLWIKPPGQSDGTCNGGPPPGQWWTSYAIGLAERASW
jgi:endoglucanase